MMHISKISLVLMLVCTFGACRQNDAQYKLEFLEGDWLRLSSSDSRSDSMQLHIAGDSAVLVFLPDDSEFIIDEKKWFSISPISDNNIHFTLKDISADASFATAQITITSDSSLTLEDTDFPLAPGALQYWGRKP